MNRNTGRPDHMEDFLVNVRGGQWFGWSDSKNKVYANLIVHDGGSKPTEQECTDGLAQMQSDHDAKGYQRTRAAAYPNIGDQLDMIFHDQVDGTTTFKEAIQAVKDANTKP